MTHILPVVIWLSQNRRLPVILQSNLLRYDLRQLIRAQYISLWHSRRQLFFFKETLYNLWFAVYSGNYWLCLFQHRLNIYQWCHRNWRTVNSLWPRDNLWGQDLGKYCFNCFQSLLWQYSWHCQMEIVIRFKIALKSDLIGSINNKRARLCELLLGQWRTNRIISIMNAIWVNYFRFQFKYMARI